MILRVLPEDFDHSAQPDFPSCCWLFLLFQPIPGNQLPLFQSLIIEELFLPEINLDRHPLKIKIFAYFIFDVAPVRSFNILWKICKQCKRRSN